MHIITPHRLVMATILHEANIPNNLGKQVSVYEIMENHTPQYCCLGSGQIQGLASRPLGDGFIFL
jgi:hypothetical protein